MLTLLIFDSLWIPIFSIVLVLVMVHCPLIEVAGSLLSKFYRCNIKLRSKAMTFELFVLVFFLKSLSMLFILCCIAVHDVCSLLSVSCKSASIKVSAPCAYVRLMSWSNFSCDTTLAFSFMFAIYEIFSIL